jgi:regulation of enolase protein 1 (concanavalin A-like superfamily)
VSNVEIQGGAASLRKMPGWLNWTTQSDFASYASALNVDLNRRPGKVVLNSTSGGPPASATYVSRLAGNGTPVTWRSIAWNASSFDDHSDDFNGSALDARWRWFNPPSSYAVGTPRPGWLTFDASRPTDFWNGAASGQFLYQAVSGEFQVDARLQTSAMSAAGQKAGILVMLPPPFSPTTFWASIHRVYSGTVGLQAVTTFNGATTANATIPANPDYLRVRRTAIGNLETYYSIDGINWTFLANVGIGNPPTILWVGIFAADPTFAVPLTLNADYVHFSFPGANPQVQVETRTGNATDTADPSWTPWSAPRPNPRGSAIGVRGAYLQYRLLLATSSLYVRPFAGNVSLSWQSRSSSGEVTTQEFRPASSMVWDLLTLDADRNGGMVLASYSLDGGAWTPVAPGGPNVTVPGGLRIRLVLSTPDPSTSPSVAALSLSFHPPPPSPAFPWWAFLPLAVIPAWLVGRRILRGTYRATDLFLIHADGRLILHVGGRQVLMRDEIAVSGMFTVVVQFVKDSFEGTGGQGGELKSLQVDEREVTIAKGAYSFLALVGHGPRPKNLESAMRGFLGAMEAIHRPTLEAWSGLGEILGDLEAQLRWFLARGYHRGYPTYRPLRYRI